MLPPGGDKLVTPSMGRPYRSLLTGTFFSKKAHSPREDRALDIVLATVASSCLSHSCWLGGTGLAPQSGVASEWEPVGAFWPSAGICVTSYINQAFPAVSHISGNFPIERIGWQPHFSASYSCLLCITAITLKKKILDCVVGQNKLKLNWSNTEAKR